MNTQDTSPSISSRREFIKTTGRYAAVSALAGMVVPAVHAASGDVIQLALVGCGGRGTGAAHDALNSQAGPVRLVAMADILSDRLNGSHANLLQGKADKMDVPPDRQFVGFDAYQHAMDYLKPGDVVILATPPAFRWVHFQYAIQKGLNVFMEKPLSVDGPTSRRMLELAEQSKNANLKVGVGLMSRHSRALQELHNRIQDGEIGEILLMRGYRMHGPVASFASTAVPASENELLYQIRRFHSFLWAGGGCFSDYYIHIIDHLSWMKNTWPEKAQALGGRHYRHSSDGQLFVDQNFDNYSVEYTFQDGSKFFFDGRCMNGCLSQFSSYVQGSKGIAVASSNGDCGAPSTIFRGQNMEPSNALWQSEVPSAEQNPYQNEWNDLLRAIRNDEPYNEVRRGVEASLVTAMGRMAAHTGQEITFENILNCENEFAPQVAGLTVDSQAPLQSGADGRYPVPEPGRKGDREY